MVAGSSRIGAQLTADDEKVAQRVIKRQSGAPIKGGEIRIEKSAGDGCRALRQIHGLAVSNQRGFFGVTIPDQPQERGCNEDQTTESSEKEHGNSSRLLEMVTHRISEQQSL